MARASGACILGKSAAVLVGRLSRTKFHDRTLRGGARIGVLRIRPHLPRDPAVRLGLGLADVLSDLEVDTEEGVEGELYEFAYPTEDGGEIVVATTRPETMLGDTAIAVHPDDPRHKHLHGKSVRHPFVNRSIPIITDAELVDMKFGTGAVKLTPAHDFNDFATGKRHGLEEINIFTLEGKLNAEGGEFAGLDRFVARKKVKARLAELGLERGSKKHLMRCPSAALGNRGRADDLDAVVMRLAAPSRPKRWNAARRRAPGRLDQTYFHWMRNIQDWCISRQLWWGHAIPAFYCGKCEHVNVTRTDPTACAKCGSADLRADPDVLDTWFSSGLWPFSTLGWPQQTPDLAKFYPGNDMETGYDILFFWVARMMMMGIHFMGQPPFKRVLLAGMVTDENGDKMSKGKGNVTTPAPLRATLGSSSTRRGMRAERRWPSLHTESFRLACC